MRPCPLRGDVISLLAVDRRTPIPAISYAWTSGLYRHLKNFIRAQACIVISARYDVILFKPSFIPCFSNCLADCCKPKRCICFPLGKCLSTHFQYCFISEGIFCAPRHVATIPHTSCNGPGQWRTDEKYSHCPHKIDMRDPSPFPFQHIILS
jgi:hypothetical protein